MILRSIRLVVSGIAVAAIVASVVQGPPLSAQGRGGGSTPSLGGYQPTRFEILSDAFVLDKDQKKSVKTILDDAHKAAEPIRNQLTATHAALGLAATSGKSQADIDAAAKAYAVQSTAMVTLEMKAMAQVLQSLTKEQRANGAAVGTTFFMMRGLFADKKWDVIPSQSAKSY